MRPEYPRPPADAQAAFALLEAQASAQITLRALEAEAQSLLEQIDRLERCLATPGQNTKGLQRAHAAACRKHAAVVGRIKAARIRFGRALASSTSY